jgi:hypothetical protein
MLYGFAGMDVSALTSVYPHRFLLQLAGVLVNTNSCECRGSHSAPCPV